MKKIITLLACSILLQTYSSAQTVTGGDMETWKSYTSLAITMSKPDGWYTLDSMVGALKQLALKTYSARVVKYTTLKHGGTACALLEVGGADSFPTMLSNGNVKIDAAAIAAASSGDFSKLKFYGGTAVSSRIKFAHAYTMYAPGKPGASSDSGTFSVTAFKTGIGVGGTDSVVGSGTIFVKANSIFTKQEVYINYVDATIVPDRIVCTFNASNSFPPISGSKMYVDDVTLSDPSGIELPMANNNHIKVYPNPIQDYINVKINSTNNFTFQLFNSIGQQIIQQQFSSEIQIPTASLVSGNYIYLIKDNTGRSLSGGHLQK